MTFPGTFLRNPFHPSSVGPVTRFKKKWKSMGIGIYKSKLLFACEFSNAVASQNITTSSTRIEKIREDRNPRHLCKELLLRFYLSVVTTANIHYRGFFVVCLFFRGRKWVRSFTSSVYEQKPKEWMGHPSVDSLFNS